MPILITEGADPLSDASMQSGSGSAVRNAPSDASRVLRLELTRYCRRELHGRSFLIAGHRGAGKTTMVADALDKVLRLSRRAEERMLRPLPIFLHGPSLFEVEAGEPHPTDGRGRRGDAEPTESQRMAAQANVALKQIILGIHRAVAKEFGQAYRRRMVETNFAAYITEPTPEEALMGPSATVPHGTRKFEPRPYADRVAFAEIAAQFELELAQDPTAARLREFWDMAQALQCGVLFLDSTQVDQGTRELVALNGLYNAHQRISGEINAQDTTARGDETVGETSHGVDVRGEEFFKPLASVIAGAAVAGGAAAGAHSLGWALGAGLVTALGSTLAFRSSTTRTTKVGRQIDTTFIPDLSLKTLDRILPTLLQHLRDAGLAPVLVVDELDKVRGLPERLVGMIHFLKKLVAENVFTCFLTDRGYLEHLRMKDRDSAYGRAYSYFSHPLLITYQPADFDAFLDKLLQVDRPGTPDPLSAAPTLAVIAPYQSTTLFSDVDTVDLEVLKWVLRHRSQMHALALTREIASLRGENNVVQIAPGVVRSEYTYCIDITFQVAIELQLAQPHVRAWLRQRPDMSQTLLDALYFPSRQWFKGHDTLVLGADCDAFHQHLVGRMNLGELAAEGSVERAVDVADALSDDDRTFFDAVLDDLLRFIGPSTDVAEATRRWEQLPSRVTNARAEPGLPVLQAMLLGDRSLLVPIAGADQAAREYGWRYLPSGVERPSMVAAGAVEPARAASAPPSPPAVSPPVGPVMDPFDMLDALQPAAAAVPEHPGVPSSAVPRPAAGQSLDEMNAHAASDFIVDVLENLSALLFPVDPAGATPPAGMVASPPASKPGPVFEMLCDRMRVLPTTPAWPRVQSAIDNLALIRGGGGNQSTRIEDMRAVHGFAAMLDASRTALHRTLVMAAYCGAARLPDRLEEALTIGMDALSAGQGFAALDAEGVAWAMERLATAAQATQSSRLATPAERAAARQLADHGLVNDVVEAFHAGSDFFVTSPADAFTRAAWDSLKDRLQRYLATGESSPADLEETLCAVRVTGPATLVTLDLQAMTMTGWTSALMRAASATFDPDAKGQDIPRWLIGCALNRLGAATLAARPRARLVEWALGRFSEDQVAAAAIFRTIGTRTEKSPPTEVTNRVAVCVTTGVDAPMGQWFAFEGPRRGLVFVVAEEHLGSMMRGPVKKLQLPALLAVAQGPGVRIADREMQRLVDGSEQLVGPLWVYRRRMAQMLEPSLVDPQDVDDVLEHAPSSELD